MDRFVTVVRVVALFAAVGSAVVLLLQSAAASEVDGATVRSFGQVEWLLALLVAVTAVDAITRRRPRSEQHAPPPQVTTPTV